MDLQDTLAGLRQHMPVSFSTVSLKDKKVGLIIVDEVVGFCAVGGGNLAPAVPNQQVADMVKNTADLARSFLDKKHPIYAFRDTHVAGRDEPPYPVHCVAGTGEEQLVPELKFLEQHEVQTQSYGESPVKFLNKDCINGFVGAIDRDYHHSAVYEVNSVVEWINANRLDTLVVVGICTDICVLDFVVSVLSARNHYYRNGDQMLPTLKDVVVWEPATSTYDLDAGVVNTIGLPSTAIHNQALTHHVGLSVMQARGAILAETLTW